RHYPLPGAAVNPRTPGPFPTRRSSDLRKRTEKEKASMYIIGAKEIIEKILPVVDNFERGLATAQEGDAFADGMKMIYKQMMTILDDLGVKAIEAVGQPFDPNYHNAVMHVEDESLGENV